MTENQQPAQGDQGISAARSRWQGILVLSAILLPMLFAYTIFNTGFGIPDGTVNKGELISSATSISELGITDTDGKNIDLQEGKKRWRIVIVANNDCDDICMQQLYLARQVHMRLNEKAVRVRRIFLNTSPEYSPELNVLMDQDYSRLKRYHVSAAAWSDAFANTNVSEQPLNGHNIYFVDQEGFAMMSYDPSHEGADLLGDIKKLLKYSYED